MPSKCLTDNLSSIEAGEYVKKLRTIIVL